MRLIPSILIILLACTQTPPEKEVLKRPNILFLFADDWSYPHAGIYGDPVVRTPTFDRIAKEGALFNNAYCAAPSCSPSRASVLSGRYPHQLKSAGNLWSIYPNEFPNYVDILTENGYYSGKTRKGWGPGDFKKGGYTHNPAGKDYDSFRKFFENKPVDQPFSFWFSSYDPHRSYVPNTGIQSGMVLEDVEVPGFLPDLACVRNDILDYYFEVERFDRECGQILKLLEEAGELENTVIVMTSDNGMPFPRAKANLYDYGTRMPLAIRWPGRLDGNRVFDEFVSFTDFAPTFLEAAGIEPPPEMSGRSLIPMFSESIDRSRVFMERERHANVRKGDLSYPMRAIRTHEYLYIRNFMTKRWPAGDPSVHQSVGQWGDVDNSITKYLIMNMENKSSPVDYFSLSFDKRPAEELYKVKEDPFQLTNLIDDPQLGDVRNQLAKELQNWMEETQDLRSFEPTSIYWDTVLYTPNYQRENFDLDSRIEEYTIQPPRSQLKIDCL